MNQLLAAEKLSFGYPKKFPKNTNQPNKPNGLETLASNLQNSKLIISDANFKIVSGDFIALLGPNGAGKTTLVKILLGILTPTLGKVNRFISRTQIGYTPQSYQIGELFPGTVAELLSLPTFKKTSVEDIYPNLKELNITPLQNEKFVNLSGGQRQRVLIALALLRNPKLLILDEPTAGIDISQQVAFYELLVKLNQKGIAILLVTHEVGMVHKLVKKVLCISHQLCCMAELKEMPELLKQMYGSNFAVHHHEHQH